MPRHPDGSVAMEALCLHCGYHINAASGLTGAATPEPEDVTVCLNCGNWMQFDENLSVRLPDDKAKAFIDSDPDCQRIQQTLRELGRQWKKSKPLP